MRVFALLPLMLLAACATKPVEVTYEPDRFGVPVPVVNGKAYPLTDEERQAIGQAFVNAYCS